MQSLSSELSRNDLQFKQHNTVSNLNIHGTIEPQIASFLGMKELTGNCRAWMKKCLYKAVQTAALEH